MPLLKDLNVSALPNLGLAFPPGEGTYPFISNAGLGRCRIGISWKVQEPTFHNYSWGGLDSRVAALRANGIEPFLTFQCDNPLFTGGGDVVNQKPTDMNHWLDFVGHAVERTQATHYSVVNEWNTPNNEDGGWLGTDQELIDFVTDTAGAINAVHPSAQVVMGGITSGALDILVLNRGLADYEVCTRADASSPYVCHPASYYQNPTVDAEITRLKGILAGVGASVDALDLHLYGPAGRIPIRVQALKNEGWAKPILCAECGGPSQNYEDYTDERHFMSVIEDTLDGLAAGLPFSLWFRLAEVPNANFGNAKTALATQQGTPKPGYDAFKFLAHVLEGATGVTATGNQYTVSHPSGPRLIAWGSGWVFPPSGELWRITDPMTGSYSVSSARWIEQLSQWPLVAGL